MLSLSESHESTRVAAGTPEIVSCLTGRVCYQVVANCSLEADGVGRLHRPEISGVGKGLGCVCRAVAMVDLGRLWAARVALARSCLWIAIHKPREYPLPLASSLAALALQCALFPQHLRAYACVASMSGLPARGLVRTLQRLRSMCACLECEY